MPSRRRFLALAGAASLAAPALAQSRVPVRFSLNLPRNGTNLPFIYGHARGFFAEEGIEITALDPAAGTDAIARVASDAYDVSFGDISSLAELYVRAPTQVPLAVFNVYRTTPAAIVSWTKDGIRKPGDLVGRTLGAPISDNGYKLFPVLAKANGLDPASVRFQNVDLRLRETLFLRREVEAITGFDSTIWLNLKKLGVKREDIHIMSYSDFGLDLYSNSILVGRRFLRQNEAAIPGLLRASARSWQEAMRNPAAAAAALVALDPLISGDIERERFEWVLAHQVLTPETARIGLGAVDPARLQRTIDMIADAYGLPAKAPVEAIWSAKYLPSLDRRMMT